VVQIPGVAGNNSFAYVTANFTIPAYAANVAIQLTNTAAFVGGQNIIIAGPANFQIVSVDSPVQITAKFLGLTGDLAPGSIISLGAEVSPTGAPGLTGVSAYTTITGTGQTVLAGTNNYAVVSSASFVVGENVIIAATGGSANFKVVSIPNGTTLNLTFLAYASDVGTGTALPLGSVVSPAGSAGQNAYTTLTAAISAIPAIGSPYTAAVLSTAWMAAGEVVVIAGPAHFRVTTIVSGTSVVLTFLGYIGDLPVVNPIPAGATVSPSGTQSPIGNRASVYANGTAYSLTTAFAQVVFGTLSPQLVLPAAGIWLLIARATVNFDVTASLVNILSLKLVRTNNTPGDVANSLTNITTFGQAPSAPAAYNGQSVILPPVFYTTANTTDNIALSGMIDTFSGSAPFVTEASIVAIQIA
jgi:hypothetical protein